MKKLLTFIAILAMSGSVYADAISVGNASFEENEAALDVEGNNSWSNVIVGWDGPDAGNEGNAFLEYIDGFVADGVDHLGIQTNDEVSQNLGVALLPNSTYELTVAVGNRNANFSPTDGTQASTFGLYVGGDAGAGGTLLMDSTVDAGMLDVSTFMDYSMMYSTGDTVPDGDLVVSLRTTGAGRAHYDNVRVSVVPEPSSIVLLCLAGLGALTQRRRR